ncbi:MAG: YqgE/AlgH family protein [Muribaculaceae bacterium]|nr:YqgE/AlgH family protein [Muribaculaceae bacterium]
MAVNKDLLHLRAKQKFPTKGDLLLAEPFLVEKFFHRSAICLVEHHENTTSMGLVLNHKSDCTLNDVIEGIEIDTEIPLYIGGPLSDDRLFYMHTLGNIIPDSVEVVPGLYINGDLRIIKSYINSGGKIEGHLRFFLGYSGWDRSQLHEEIQKNTWAVLPIDDNRNKYLRGCGNAYWEQRVVELGEDYRPWLICPALVSLN